MGVFRSRVVLKMFALQKVTFIVKVKLDLLILIRKMYMHFSFNDLLIIADNDLIALELFFVWNISLSHQIWESCIRKPKIKIVNNAYIVQLLLQLWIITVRWTCKNIYEHSKFRIDFRLHKSLYLLVQQRDVQTSPVHCAGTSYE